MVPPIQTAYEGFTLSRRAMRCSPATLEHFRYSAGAFVTSLELQGVGDPKAVTSQLVRAWQTTLTGAAENLHVKDRGIETLPRFGHGEKYVPDVVTVAMPRPDRKVLPFLTSDQFRAVLKACPSSRSKALVMFLAGCGLRRAEAPAVTRNDLDLAPGLAGRVLALVVSRNPLARGIAVEPSTTIAPENRKDDSSSGFSLKNRFN